MPSVGRSRSDAGSHSLLTRAVGVEHLDSEESRLLGNAVRLGADGAGDVGAVTVAVGVILVGVVGEKLGPSLELLCQTRISIQVPFTTNHTNQDGSMHTGLAASMPVSMMYAQVPSPALSSKL